MREKIRWYFKLFWSIKSVGVYGGSLLDLIKRFPNEREEDDGASFARVTQKEIPELMKLHDNHCTKWNYLFSMEEAKERLSRGHRCFAVYFEGRMVGFLWAGVGKIYSKDLNFFLNMKDKSYYSSNGFVLPEFRNKKVYQRLNTYAMLEMRNEGFEGVYGIIRTINKPAIKAVVNLGLEKVGWIYCGYVLGLHVLQCHLSKNCGMRIERAINPWHRYKRLLPKVEL